MFNSAILDVALGLVFIYTLLSLVCSSLKEGVSRRRGMRARCLEAGIRRLLANDGSTEIVDRFWRHPLIQAMGDGRNAAGQRRFSYLPARTFALALLDIVAPITDTTPRTIASLDATLRQLPDGELRTCLLTLLQAANGDVERFRQHLEQWFDDAMDRVTGWYRRWTNAIVLAFGLGIVVLGNIDSFAIAANLWQSPSTRATLSAAATQFLAQEASTTASPSSTVPLPPAVAVSDLQRTLSEVAEAGFPIGWRPEQVTVMGELDWLLKMLGLLLTVAAVSLGAPFWFDVLNRVANLRAVGNKPKSGAGG